MNSKEDVSFEMRITSNLTICMVTPYPPRFGGIATYSDELIHAIKSYGHTVYVICNPDVRDGGHGGQEGVYPAMDVEKMGWHNDVFKAIKDVDQISYTSSTNMGSMTSMINSALTYSTSLCS